jgi:hypothetical protein
MMNLERGDSRGGVKDSHGVFIVCRRGNWTMGLDPFARMVLYRWSSLLDGFGCIGPIRLTEDPAGLPYKLARRSWI